MPEAVQSFFPALGELAKHPRRLLSLWNWKSAWLSILMRGPIFLVAGFRQGFLGVLATLAAECAFCAGTAGFYGAFVQLLRDAEPEWLTVLFLTVAVPAVFQAVEYVMHRLRGTPHLFVAEVVSLAASGVAVLFNWFAMRRGAFLVGGEGASLGADLRRMPALVARFLWAPFRTSKARY